jgi:hypothetical protein
LSNLEIEDHIEPEETDIIFNQNINQDTNRRRMRVLKAIIRGQFFKNHNKVVTDEMLKDEMKDITDKEIEVRLLIINKIMSYIPSKERYGLISHQVPFCPASSSHDI